MNIQGIHHVAYRCNNAKQTVTFYQQLLNMDFQLAIAENKVPSTGEPDPYMHIFMDAGNGNVLAFFELPQSPDMGSDINTPKWVQHIAFKVPDMETLLATKEHIKNLGIIWNDLKKSKKTQCVENQLSKNIQFKNLVIGILVGQFNEIELDKYLLNSREYNKRILQMTIQRIISTI